MIDIYRYKGRTPYPLLPVELDRLLKFLIVIEVMTSADFASPSCVEDTPSMFDSGVFGTAARHIMAIHPPDRKHARRGLLLLPPPLQRQKLVLQTLETTHWTTRLTFWTSGSTNSRLISWHWMPTSTIQKLHREVLLTRCNSSSANVWYL